MGGGLSEIATLQQWVGIAGTYRQKVGKNSYGGPRAFALRTRIHRLELTVMTHNTRALHLYEMDYRVEGIRRDLYS